MARSVLRLKDQKAGRFPDRCVLSGVATDRAVHATAVRWNGRRWILGVPGVVPVLSLLPGWTRCRVSLPVSAKVWSTWNRRNLAALIVLVFGVGLILASAVRQTGDLFGVGVVLGVIAVVYRTRAHYNFWTTCRVGAGEEQVIVERLIASSITKRKFSSPDRSAGRRAVSLHSSYRHRERRPSTAHLRAGDRSRLCEEFSWSSTGSVALVPPNPSNLAYVDCDPTFTI